MNEMFLIELSIGCRRLAKCTVYNIHSWQSLDIDILSKDGTNIVDQIKGR